MAQTPSNIAGISTGQLRSYIERIERLEEEKTNISADIREVFAEAKLNGYDTKIMRNVIKLRKIDPNERDEQEMLLDTYLRALGMLPPEQENDTTTADDQEAA